MLKNLSKLIQTGPENDSESFIPDLCNLNALLFLLLAAQLLTVALLVVSQGIGHFTWQEFAAASLFVQWIGLMAVGTICGLRPILSQFSALIAGVICWLVVVLATVIVTLFAQWMWRPLDPFSWLLTLNSCVVAGIIAAVWLRYLHLQYVLQMQQHSALQARLDALQARIRPHFLFNSMNTIASMISIDPDAAETMIEELAVLFRASFSDRPSVTLAEEISLVQCYLHIEQIRMGSRLQVKWNIDEGLHQAQLPGVCLQPLLENAVHHGVQRIPEGGTVTINAERQRNRCVITICNPVADSGPGKEGNGMAMDNVRHRLAALFGESGQLRTRQSAEYFEVELSVPAAEEQVDA